MQVVRPLLLRVPKGQQRRPLCALRAVFGLKDANKIESGLNDLPPLVGGLLPQDHQLMLEAKDDVLGFPHFPSGISGLGVVVVK